MPDDSVAASHPEERIPGESSSAVRRLRVRVAVTAAIVIVAIVTAAMLGKQELLAFFNTCIEALRAAGPVPFFAGMALLPAVGFPLLPFVLAAGPVFGPTMGTGTVIACAIGAVAANVALSYALAARAMRPLVLRLMARLNYKMPAVPGNSTWQVVWLVRLAPGLPFWTQSYLLGIARTPFVPYMIVSTLLPAAYISGTIVFGKKLFEGHMKHALIALAAVGLVAVTVQIWRRRRRPAAASSSPHP